MNPKQKQAGLAASRLSTAASVPLYRQIYGALRDDILEGRLAPGQRLAATRVLASDLGVSRKTVLEAHDQLFAEGYLERRVGAGTFVSSELPDELLQAPPTRPLVSGEVTPPPISQRALEVDALGTPVDAEATVPFRPGIPDLRSFPFQVWTRLATTAAGALDASSASYAATAGRSPLRSAIAEHLYRSRGVACEPENVIIVLGSQQGFDLTFRTLLDPGDEVLVEDPGYMGLRSALRSAGARIVPVPVDEEGIKIDHGCRNTPRARLACVTPSHQYPAGPVLCLKRRLRLLEWARQADAWVLEDDYDSEYRYSSRPLAALRSLDTDGRVIYLGTFSKVLFPGLRLGYLVVPSALVGPFSSMHSTSIRQAPVLEQDIATRFLEEGHFATHLRRMRMVYKTRQDALVDALRRHADRWVEVRPDEAGSHLVGWLPPGTDDQAVAAAAREAGLVTPALSSFSLEHRMRPGLVLGYGAFDEHTIEDGVDRLAEVLRRAIPRTR